MGVPGGPPPPGGPWGVRKQEKKRNERWVHLDGNVPVRYYCMTGNLWPMVEHESMTGHLPRSCLEMKMNKLSAERIDPRWNKTWDTVIVNTLSRVGDKDVRECDSLSWCWGLAMDLFHQDPWGKHTERFNRYLAHGKASQEILVTCDDFKLVISEVHIHCKCGNSTLTAEDTVTNIPNALNPSYKNQNTLY